MRFPFEGGPHTDSSSTPSVTASGPMLLYDVKHVYTNFSEVLSSHDKTQSLYESGGKDWGGSGDGFLSLLQTLPRHSSTMLKYLNSINTCPFMGFGKYGNVAGAVDEHSALIDSGADVHVLSYEAALLLFEAIKASELQVIGVSGARTRAAVQGQLVVTLQGPSGARYKLDLGTAHGMKNCPMNLLSLSLLLDIGAVLHFEQGNCWIQPPAHLRPDGDSERIPLQRVGGLFQVPISKFVPKKIKVNTTGNFDAEDFPHNSEDEFDNTNLHSCALHGRSFLSGDLTLWHRRMRHMSKEQLKRVHAQGLVDGFHMSGNQNTACGCDTCAQAKIRKARNERNRKYSQPATVIGDHVSSDVKSLPYESFEGYKYVVNFVDHHSRLGICYMMRTKDETCDKFGLYCAELAHYGFRVKHVHSDRGSEYFSQEGHLLAGRDRTLSALDQYCAAQQPTIKHTVTPVAAKEKIAESWFRDHFEAADALLWEARLSPAFWADAILYSQHIANRVPNCHTGPSTPHQMLTGERSRWDKIRVFGADAYHVIPNDDLAKIPGIVKGNKVIFVGFTVGCNGYRVFDPESREYSTVSDVYFYEGFSHRIDALRHHDRRRELLKQGKVQPPQIDDFDDPDETARGVRNLFMDPDAPRSGAHEDNDNTNDALQAAEHAENDNTNGALQAAEHAQNDNTNDDDLQAEESADDTPSSASQRSVNFEKARQLLQSSEVLRPLRLLPFGKEALWTKDDSDFMTHALLHDIPIAFVPNPKNPKGKGASYRRYDMYSPATTIRQAIELGATRDDIKWDYRRAFIKFPKHESPLPGHIYCAIETADEYRHTHVLDDVGAHVTQAAYTDYMLARAFLSPGLERAKYVFNDLIRSAFDPELLPKELESRATAIRFSEAQFAKVLNASSGVNIDFSLAAEPTRWEQTLPGVCSESEQWKEAMDDEITSMVKFGVYRALPRSAAGNKQILGCRWVYKRKTNRFGEVFKYRARLVALGYRQKPFDSYDPDATFSPVIHKDTLRMFLSVCAAENLQIYQADVKAAFLQAPLEEEIFIRPPPGYSAVDESTGEPTVWGLKKAIYGLKQSSACFWTAMHKHLVKNGFVSILGDPCLFRKEFPDGRIILAVLYVDDCTFAISEEKKEEGHRYFMDMMRSRFVIDEGEGAPVDWLLGMAIEQNLEQGTVRINMETAITKLAIGLLTPEELIKSADVTHPMLSTSMLPKLGSREVSVQDFDYLSVVGSLMHLANCVRCDVAYAVGVLARHALAPGKAHVKALKRVVKYLYNTRALGITYQRSGERNVPVIHEGAKHPLSNEHNKLQTFADSDYAADETRRSTFGNVIMMNGGPISWTSTLGKTVATSTCEAEVNAAVNAVKDAVHINKILYDLKLIEKRPLIIKEDNSACIAQANSGIRHVRNAKHYEIRLRFLQQKVVDKEVEFEYCPTDHQLADVFTKPLDETKFLGFRKYLLS